MTSLWARYISQGLPSEYWQYPLWIFPPGVWHFNVSSSLTWPYHIPLAVTSALNGMALTSLLSPALPVWYVIGDISGRDMRFSTHFAMRSLLKKYLEIPPKLPPCGALTVPIVHTNVLGALYDELSTCKLLVYTPLSRTVRESFPSYGSPPIFNIKTYCDV